MLTTIADEEDVLAVSAVVGGVVRAVAAEGGVAPLSTDHVVQDDVEAAL